MQVTLLYWSLDDDDDDDDDTTTSSLELTTEFMTHGRKEGEERMKEYILSMWGA